MPTAQLTYLLQKLDAPSGRYAMLDRYYQGEQPLAFLSPEARVALGNRFGRIASNIPRLAVTALAERLRITGFSGDGDVWQDWLANDLDQTSHLAHRESLLLGDSYCIVWADASGSPQVTVESAKQVAVQRDPATRHVVAAVKRWTTRDTTEAVYYLPDRIIRLRANNTGATITGFETVAEIANPLGVVPVVPIHNGDRIYAPSQWVDIPTDFGHSEVWDLIPLVDGLNKTLADMMIASEFTARPRRWATGVELIEDDEGQEVNPISESYRAMIAESPEAKFGQLPGADLAGYETAVRVLLGQIMAVSTLPAHYIGIMTDNPASADALRAAEASLTARAEAKQAAFGRAWEQVARLMVAVRTGADPQQINCQAQWADAATRSVAQQADAIVKLVQSGILPISYALAKLGYSQDEIDAIRAARRTDVLDGAGAQLLSDLAS